MNNLDSIFEKSHKTADYIQGYFDYLTKVIQNVNRNEVERFIQFLLLARELGKKIFFIGNGGSAATASHFANDLVAGMRVSEKPFKAISLTDNNALLTALANDEGYEKVFIKQLEVLMNEGDFVVAISASGNSSNLLEAIKFAKTKNAKVFGLVGFDGGEMKDLCDDCVHIVSNKGEYGPVEDLHMILDHVVSTYLYRFIRLNK